MSCRPYICRYPSTADHKRGDRWMCGGCGTVYRLTGPKPPRFWRNWSAPNGYWKVSK